MAHQTAVVPHGRSKQSSWALAVTLGAVLLAAVTLSVPTLRDRIISTKNTAWVTVQRGAYQGHAWQLDVQEKDGQFCMSVVGPRGPSDVTHTLTAACGFENKPQNAAFYYSDGPGPTADSNVVYGPLPSNAVSIRVATNQVLPTYPIPHQRGLPVGRFWIEFCSASCATPPGTALDRAQPLDAEGNVVAFKRF